MPCATAADVLRCPVVVRLLLASLTPEDGPEEGFARAGEQVAGADVDVPAGQVLPRLARALRDAGHEVVHAGQGLPEAVVVAAAVQEDVEVVVLLAPPSYDADALAADVSRQVGEEAGEHVPVVAVTSDATTAGSAADRAAQVVRQVSEQLHGGVADDTSRAPADQG